MNKLHIGIDNGVSGAIAAIDTDGVIIQLRKMPITKIGKEQSVNGLEVFNFVRMLRDIAKYADVHAILEHPTFNPVSGKKSIASTWGSFRAIETALCIIGVSWEPVAVKTWQKEMFKGYANTSDDTKAASVAIVQRLFPKANLLLTERCRVPDDGLADALLIAEFSRRFRQ